MLHRLNYQALDRTMQSVRDNKGVPFAGVPMLFTGDFRQTLPVVLNGTTEECIEASLKRSPLWEEIKVMHLEENFRIKRRIDQNPV